MLTTDHVHAVVVLVTWPAGRDPRPFAATLVEERLAACASILAPMQSIYRWQGKVEQDQEHQILVKTTRGRLPALVERVSALHPYDVPEFLVMPVEAGSTAYLAWLGQETRAEA